jgi:hypothetical protein
VNNEVITETQTLIAIKHHQSKHMSIMRIHIPSNKSLDHPNMGGLSSGQPKISSELRQGVKPQEIAESAHEPVAT